VSLHPSSLAAGGIGLFAERQFEKNTPLGFYISKKSGRMIKKVEASHLMTGWTTKLAYSQQNIICLLLITIAKCKSFDPSQLSILMQGNLNLSTTWKCITSTMHVTPIWISKFANKLSKINTLIIKDGIVHAVKKIMPNQEIFMGCTEEEHNNAKNKPTKSSKNVRKPPVKKPKTC
jgi:hypothetical protein